MRRRKGKGKRGKGEKMGEVLSGSRDVWTMTGHYNTGKEGRTEKKLRRRKGKGEKREGKRMGRRI